jgi:hypothetical protein
MRKENLIFVLLDSLGGRFEGWKSIKKICFNQKAEQKKRGYLFGKSEV